MECCCHQRNVQDLLADGKTLHGRRFGESFKGPIIPFRVMAERRIEIQANRKSINLQDQKMRLEHIKTFGRYKVTSFSVITLNFEFNFTCRKRIHCLFH